MLILLTSINLSWLLEKAQAAQIYAYNFDNYSPLENTYYDPTLASNENKCLNGLINKIVQTGDNKTIEACLNTFG